MTTQLCTFIAGACIHCGDTTQGECEGWNEPEKSAREMELEAEVARLTDLAQGRLEQMDADRKQALRWRDEVGRLREALKTHIRIYQVDDMAWDTAGEVDRVFEQLMKETT